jgi:hypothetical protein
MELRQAHVRLAVFTRMLGVRRSDVVTRNVLPDLPISSRVFRLTYVCARLCECHALSPAFNYLLQNEAGTMLSMRRITDVKVVVLQFIVCRQC